MRKLLPLLLLAVAAATPTYAASPTDWLNFAETQDGDVLYAVQFADSGKLHFGDTTLSYDDENGVREIPYTAAGYMFFSAESQAATDPSAVLGLKTDEPILKYQPASQTVELTCADKASSITLYNMQGVVIGKVFDAKSLPVTAPTGSVVIATAEYNGLTLNNKFIVK